MKRFIVGIVIAVFAFCSQGCVVKNTEIVGPVTGNTYKIKEIKVISEELK